MRGDEGRSHLRPDGGEEREELVGRELGDDDVEIAELGEEYGDAVLGRCDHHPAARGGRQLRARELLGDVGREHVVEHGARGAPRGAQLDLQEEIVAVR